MNTIQSNYYPQMYQTLEQRKAAYDRMYDENGDMKLIKGEDFKVTDVPGFTGKPQMKGYAIERLGDDYVVFAENSASFNGGNTLTKEQLEYLRGKYDMDNLSKEDRIKLLAELSCMGVVSGSDAYAEAFPEKCSWAQDKWQQFGVDGDETDLSKWIEYYLLRATLAKSNMDKSISNNVGIAHYESERKTSNFYSALAQVMKLAKNPCRAFPRICFL